MQPRSQFVSLTAEAAATTDTRLAAAIYALDVPFEPAQMAATFAGDGIKGKLVTWYFQPANPQGHSSAAMAKAWDDAAYHKSNPDCPLVRIKAAFERKEELTKWIRERTIKPFAAQGPFIETSDTAKAAGIEKLGHPLTGIAYRDGKYWWRFSQAAAADFALWDLPGKELEERMQDALIAYLQCAFRNHRAFIDLVKKPKANYALVKHGERTAVVGSEASKAEVDTLERLLYRR